MDWKQLYGCMGGGGVQERWRTLLSELEVLLCTWVEDKTQEMAFLHPLSKLLQIIQIVGHNRSSSLGETAQSFACVARELACERIPRAVLLLLSTDSGSNCSTCWPATSVRLDLGRVTQKRSPFIRQVKSAKRTLVWDATCPDTMAPSCALLSIASEEAGAIAITAAAEQTKRMQYATSSQDTVSSEL